MYLKMDLHLKWMALDFDIDAFDLSATESALALAARKKNYCDVAFLTSALTFQAVKNRNIKSLTRILNSSRADSARCFVDACVNQTRKRFALELLESDCQSFPRGCIAPEMKYLPGGCITFSAWLYAVKIANDCNYNEILDVLFKYVHETTTYGFTALHLAVLFGQRLFGYSRFREVEILTKSERFDLNASTSYSQTLLHLLCFRPLNENRFDHIIKDYTQDKQDENYKIATLLIENGIAINQKDIQGKTPLMIACQNGYTSVVEALVLVSWGWAILNLDARDSSEESAFTIAGRNKDCDILTCLISALFWKAVYTRNEKMVKKVRDCSREICARRFKDLCIYPIKGRFLIDLLELKLQGDPPLCADHEIEQKDKEHPTGSCITFRAWMRAIVFATINEYQSMVDFLLRFERLVCGTTRDGFTALHLSMPHFQLQFSSLGLSIGIFEILIKSEKFDINALTNCQETVLHSACRWQDASQVEMMLELLFRYKVKVNQINCWGQTALMVACKNRNVVAARELLKWKDPEGVKLDISATDDKGMGALSLAYQSGSSEIAAMIEHAMLITAIENGDLETIENVFIQEFVETVDDIEEPCANKMTTSLAAQIDRPIPGNEWNILQRFVTGNLSRQIKSNRVDLIPILLKSRNFKVNTLTSSSQNILHLLCPRQLKKRQSDLAENYKIATLLLENGVDFNHKDERGRTPLILACENGYNSVAKALLAWNSTALGKEGSNSSREPALFMLTCKASGEAVEDLVKCNRMQLDIDANDYSGESALVKSARNLNCNTFSRLSSALFLKSVKQNDMKAVTRFLNSSTEECAICFKDLCVQLIAIRFKVDFIALDWQFRSCVEPGIEYPSESCVTFNAWLNAVKIADDCKYDSMLDLLFKFEEEVSGVRRDGLTALHLAVFHCQTQFGHNGLKALEVLIKSNQFDVNALSCNLETVLHFVCHCRYAENVKLIIELVLKNKVNVNQRNIFGQTALMIACKNQSTVAVQALLKWKEDYGEKLDIEARDNKGQTFLSIAQQLKNKEIEAIIEQELFLKAVESGDAETVKAYMRRLNENRKIEENPMKTLNARILRKPLSIKIENQSETNEVTPMTDHTLIDESRVNDGTDEVQSITVNSITHSVFLEGVYMAYCKSKEENSHNDVLNLLLKGNYYMHKHNKKGQTVLHSAVKEYIDNKCEFRRLQTIETLLNFGSCGVNALNSQKETVLHQACKLASHTDLVLDALLKLFLDHRIHLNSKDRDGKTCLLIACENENTNVVRTLLNLTRNNGIHLDADADDKSHEGKNSNSVERFRQVNRASSSNLQNEGTNWISMPYIFEFDTWKDAAYVAIENSFDEILRLLLEYDVLVQRQTGFHGESILTQLLLFQTESPSEKSMCIKLCEKLLESGNINASTMNFEARTALHYYYRGTPDELLKIIRLLFLHGASVNQKDYEGRIPIASNWSLENTPLMEGILICAEKFGTWLDLDAKDAFGRTPLMVSAKWKRSDAVRMLLKAGASVTFSDHRGFTALHHALNEIMSHESYMNFGDFPKNSAELKKRKKTNIVLYDIEKPRESYRPVMQAMKLNEEKRKMTELLLGCADLDINALTCEGYSPLDIAEASIPEIASCITDLLKMKGARLNVFQNKSQQSHLNADPNGNINVLHRRGILTKVLAQEYIEFIENQRCIPNDEDSVQQAFFNLDASIQRQLISARDQKGRTPLHGAVISCQIKHYIDKGDVSDCNIKEVIRTVKMFLSFGCGVNETDIYRRTPLHYADSEDLNKLLIKEGADPEIKDKDGLSAMKLSQILQNQHKLLFTPDLDPVVKIVKIAMECIGELKSFYVQNGKIEIRMVSLGTHSNVKWTKDLNPKTITEKLWREGDYAFCHPSVNEVREEVTEFIQNLASEMKKRDWRLEVEPVLVGSSYEGTKIDLPDEFDFSFVLTKVSPLCEVSPSPELPCGFVHLKRKQNIISETEDRELSSFFRNDFILDVERLQVHFRNILAEVLTDALFIETHQTFDWNCDTGIATEEGQDPRYPQSKFVATLQLRRTKLDHGSKSVIDISVDIAPCIHIKDCWPDDAISNVSDDIKALGCKLIFYRPQKLYRWVPYSESCARISFAHAESKMIRQSSDIAKQAFMIGKQLLRKASRIFLKRHRYSAHETCYILKNCFLHCIEALTPNAEKASRLGLNQDALKSKLNQFDRQMWLECLMKCHLDFVSRDFAPCYFMPNFYIPITSFLKEFHMSYFTGAPHPRHDVCILAYQSYHTISSYASDVKFQLSPPDPIFEHFDREKVIADILESSIDNLIKAKRCCDSHETLQME